MLVVLVQASGVIVSLATGFTLWQLFRIVQRQ